MAAPDRRRHVDELFAALGPLDDPMILGADVNEHPGKPAWAALAERLPEAGAGTPGRHIDGIFASPALKVLSTAVIESPDARIASDHLPLLAEFELPR
jgi:endonuclease/exonuclease/phosphatase family metal-dependent hydrolase